MIPIPCYDSLKLTKRRLRLFYMRVKILYNTLCSRLKLLSWFPQNFYSSSNWRNWRNRIENVRTQLGSDFSFRIQKSSKRRNPNCLIIWFQAFRAKWIWNRSIGWSGELMMTWHMPIHLKFLSYNSLKIQLYVFTNCVNNQSFSHFGIKSCDS